MTTGASESAPTYQKRRKKPLPLVIGAAVAVIALIAAVIVGMNVVGSKKATDRELSIGLILEPTNLNIRETAGVALDQVLIDNVYQGLVGLKPGTVDKFRPVLATKMPKISDDAKTYTFTLRKDVRFHSGHPLKADDVVDSLTQTLTKDTIGQTPKVTAEGDHRVTIELSEPYSPLLWTLASRPGLITEKGATNNMANSANGTGPYRLEKWRQNDSITLTPNTRYWGEKASLDRVVFRFVPDARAAVNAIREGELDVHTALINPSLRREFAKDKEVRLVRSKSTDVFTLAYNTQKAPFQDPRVRQALSQAIDTSAIIDAQNGDGKPLGGPITELEPGYEDLTKINAYNPERAKQLLAEAGAENLSLTITAPNHYDQNVLDIISSQLQHVGVSVKIQPVEFSSWLETVYTNHDYDLSYIDHAEAGDFGHYADPNYYFGYNNPKVQQLFRESLTATSPETAAKRLSEAARIVAEDAPAKWLFNYTPTLVIRNSVHGFPTRNTNSRLPLEGVTISE